MKIQWKDLKAAESGWKLNSFQRTEILENCLQGRKARRFSWRWVALPAAYLGTVAAVCLVGFLLWPYIARPQEIPSVIIDGPNAGAAPNTDVPPIEGNSQPVEMEAAYLPIRVTTKEYRAEGEPEIYQWSTTFASDGTLLEERSGYEVEPVYRYEAKHYYDDQWRLIRTEAEAEAGDTTKTYTYDDQNRIIKRVSINQGANVGSVDLYEYDSQGRIILAETTGYQGVVESYFTEEDVYHTESRSYAYDAEGRLTEMRHLYDEELLCTYTCTYDGQGNLIRLEKEDQDGQVLATILTYDENNRCIEAQMGERTIRYTYDDAGNIAVEAQYIQGALTLEREYTYQLYQDPNAYSAFRQMPMEEVLGELRALDIGPIISDGKTYKIQSSVKVEKVVGGEEMKIEQLTAGELGAHFDYEIYYYGIEEFYLNIDGEVVELRHALKQDPAILERLYDLWKMDHGSSYMYSDGGTCVYPYGEYTAIKRHQIIDIFIDETTMPQRGYNQDLIIALPGVSLNDIDDLIPAKDIYY